VCRKDLSHWTRNDLIKLAISSGIPFDYGDSTPVLIDRISNYTESAPPPVSRNAVLTTDHKIHIFCHWLFVISLTVGLALGVISLILSMLPNRVQFCDDGSSASNCRRCPPLAHCEKFKAVCPAGFSLVGHWCVYNDTDGTHVSSLLDSSINALRARAGEFHCELSDVDWMSFDQLENLMLSQFDNNSEDFLRVSGKVFRLLNMVDDVRTEQIEGADVFVSGEFDRDWKCEIRLSVYRHLSVIIFVTVLLGASGCFLYWKIMQRQMESECQHYADLVIRHLRFESKGVTKTSEQLRNWFDQRSGGGAARFWPRVQELIRGSPLIESWETGASRTFRYSM
jgi:hypothetical protein